LMPARGGIGIDPAAERSLFSLAIGPTAATWPAGNSISMRADQLALAMRPQHFRDHVFGRDG